jgi:hypothetical protein
MPNTNQNNQCPNCGQFKLVEKTTASMYFYIIFFVVFFGGCALQEAPGGGVGFIIIGIGGMVLTYFISNATKGALVFYKCENCDFEQSYSRKKR